MKQSEARALIESKVTVDENGCWIWPNAKRYGSTTIDGKWYRTHRLAYLAYHGRIGKQHVLHSCDNPPCCNPEHLFLGTHLDNMADLVTKDRSGSRELKNKNGKFTDDQVREMRTKHSRGIPASWIADEYGTTPGYVRAIVKRVAKGRYHVRHHADLPCQP